MVLKSRIWSYPGGDKYSFVDDVCLQCLHCTDEDQQSETARLSTVGSTLVYSWAGSLEFYLFSNVSFPIPVQPFISFFLFLSDPFLFVKEIERERKRKREREIYRGREREI